VYEIIKLVKAQNHWSPSIQIHYKLSFTLSHQWQIPTVSASTKKKTKT